MVKLPLFPSEETNIIFETAATGVAAVAAANSTNFKQTYSKSLQTLSSSFQIL